VTAFTRGDVLDGLTAEGGRLAAVMLELAEDDFGRPTACVPWTVAELLAHVVVASDRLPDVLAEPEPAHASIAAADYYRPDERFSSAANQVRVAAARHDAAASTGHALAERFDAAWREMVELAAAQPATRVVRTRWGDAMLLTDFLVTRVVEIAVHGLDLAAGLDRQPWTTPQAAVLVAQLLLGPRATGALATLGWDSSALIRKATGRASLSDAEARLLAEHGVRRLTLA
jgi:uncharacterized protein (TIGR03083 family)